MRLRLVIAASVVGLSVPLIGQSLPPADGPDFEVASIKRTVGSNLQRTGIIPTAGRFVAVRVFAQALIGYAYQGAYEEMKNAPDWTRSEQYDVNATLPPNATEADMPRMMRRLLADRFKLAAHLEEEERDVFFLTRVQPDAPLPSALERVDQDCSQMPVGRPELPKAEDGAMPACLSMDNGRTYNSGGLPMASLAVWLRQPAGRQVIDRTGLPGHYRFVLRYSRPNVANPDADREYPDAITAVREQLGLRLTAGRAPVRLLVVDTFERPTEN